MRGVAPFEELWQRRTTLEDPVRNWQNSVARNERSANRMHSPLRYLKEPQNSALPGVRGNGITSRMFDMPVMNWTTRSSPKPKPLWGTVP